MPLSTKPNGDVALAIAILRQRFGKRLQTGEAVRRQHANTLTWMPNEPPDAVIWVESRDEVCEVVRVASTHRVPIIPFGAGTSLEGHINAPRGGLSVDFSHMNRVLAVNERDLDCVVEPGVSRRQLNEYLREMGLFFPVDPGAEEATIGGMASTRASGTTALRYGTMRENVLNLTAVMADGSLVKTAQRARKSAAGYDLTRLMVGSEGTLGIITELTVRLYGIPELILSAVCPFRTLEGACNTVIHSMQLGLGVARMEVVDEAAIYAVNKYAKLGLEEAPTLFLEFHGTDVSARNQVELFRQIAESEGAIRFDWAEKEEDRRRLWKARHEFYWAVKSTWPGKDTFATDICVPISRLAECIIETKKDNTGAPFPISLVGHAGDGNFHLNYIIDPARPEELEAARRLNERLVLRALAMDGTCTGEHGIGYGKMKYLETEHGSSVEVMRTLKRALDPDNRMNPGKMVDI